MFEFDAGKLIIIGIVALIVIGPKELPRVMRYVGEAVAKMRRMAAEFRSQFMDAMRESELEEIKSEVETLADSAKAGAGPDPLAQIRAELTQVIDAAGKPSALPGAGAAAITSPHESEPPLKAIGFPDLPDAPEEAAGSNSGAGAAPSALETKRAAAGAIDVEMRALADALAAEIGETAPGCAGAARSKAPDEG